MSSLKLRGANGVRNSRGYQAIAACEFREKRRRENGY